MAMTVARLLHAAFDAGVTLLAAADAGNRR
jgi:hypothetical protein